MTNRNLLLIIPLLCSWSCVAASVRPAPELEGPPPRMKGEVAAWRETLRTRPGWALFIRNDRDKPIRVASLTLYQCTNVLGPCGTEAPNILVEPGQTRIIRHVEPAIRGRWFTAGWRYQWRGVEGWGPTLDKAVVLAVSENVRRWSTAFRADVRPWYWELDLGGLGDSSAAEQLVEELQGMGPTADTASAVLQRGVRIGHAVISGDTARVPIELTTVQVRPCSRNRTVWKYSYLFVRVDVGWSYGGGARTGETSEPSDARPRC